MTSKTLRLSAHLAIDSRRRKQAHETITELHRQTQLPAVMTGIIKTYVSATEEGQTYPSESKRVQLRARDAIEQLSEALAGLINTTGTKDYTNSIARADVVVDGKVLIKEAPPPFLLFLEKELRDLRTFIEKILELDPAQEWTYDAANGVYRTPATMTQKTAKIQDTVVVVQATDKFPAQVKDVTKDVVVGQWATTHLSAGLPRSEKEAILRRITRLEEAVKTAREQANLTEVVTVEVGQDVVQYLLGPSIRQTET